MHPRATFANKHLRPYPPYPCNCPPTNLPRHKHQPTNLKTHSNGQKTLAHHLAAPTGLAHSLCHTPFCRPPHPHRSSASAPFNHSFICFAHTLQLYHTKAMSWNLTIECSSYEVCSGNGLLMIVTNSCLRGEQLITMLPPTLGKNTKQCLTKDKPQDMMP